MSPRLAFRPPHCPTSSCKFHLDPEGWRYKKIGFFARRVRPFRVQRYLCFTCKRTFSSQTFHVSYRLRRPELLEPVFHGEIGGSCHRQLARQHGVSHTTIMRMVERIGRHCILFHESFRDRARARAGSEPVVLDGLISFARGQYWPVELTGLVGTKSYYSHDYVATPLRRSGKMTCEQKKKRVEYERRLGRPDPQARRKDVLDLLRASLPEGTPIELRSDENLDYVWALRRLGNAEVEHFRTHSKAPRTPKNPLFAVNAHHAFMRHSAGNQKRETIAFSKCFKAVVWRHAIFQAWQNWVKGASERDPTMTPAQRLGITSRKWKVAELLEVPLSVTRMKLRERVLRGYFGLQPRPFEQMTWGRGPGRAAD